MIKTGLPSFIVTLAALFILRGLTLALTRSITGRTQIPYITQGSEDAGSSRSSPATFCQAPFAGSPMIGVIGIRPDGAPTSRACRSRSSGGSG